MILKQTFFRITDLDAIAGWQDAPRYVYQGALTWRRPVSSGMPQYPNIK